MKYSNLLIVSIVLLGCTNSHVESLATEPTINSVYSQNEIEDLTTILDFFESQICQIYKLDGENTLDCYRSFFEQMKSLMETGEFDTKISFEKQKELYQQISKSTFDKIWTYTWVIKNTQDSRDTLKSIIWNYEGKHIDFLKVFAEDNDVVKRYIDANLASGDISPMMIADIQMFYEKYDINDIRMRLLIAIHYLTLNDNAKRLEKTKISA